MNEPLDPLGKKLDNWQAPNIPTREKQIGQYCSLEPLSTKHSQDLWQAYRVDTTDTLWQYLP
jgi:hypothetical protein